MKKTVNGILLSAGDLAGHIACHHLSYLNLAEVKGRIDGPDFVDPSLVALQRRGQEFEASILRRFHEEGKVIIGPDADSDQLSVDRTVSAMKSGADVIYQASLRHGNWQGIADFLIKVPKPGQLGAWSYEVMDSKLARDTKAGTILQLCLYSHLVSCIQGSLPEEMHVVTPEDGLSTHSYRSDNFMAYFRLIATHLQAIVDENPAVTPTYPIPCAHCDICRWWAYCDRQRRNDDHLSFVAGMSNSQIAELQRWNIRTLAELGQTPLPLPFKPSRGALDTYVRLREQARLQLAARLERKPRFEFVVAAEGKGLASLPEPNRGDIFFDFEGDPFVGNSGLEYLFGWVGSEAPEIHRALWAFSPDEEKLHLEQFVDEMLVRSFDCPGFHVYHFSPYEPSALKRLMGRYATREDEIDSMLRAGKFVDLHSVVRQAVRAGIESYSLKELEKIHSFERRFELRKAAAEKRTLELHLETNDAAGIPDSAKAAVATYNFEDCLSALALRDFLEELRSKQISAGDIIARPVPKPGDPKDSIMQHLARIKLLVDQLSADVSIDPLARSPEQHARWLLANMVDWYRREKKATWWEYFRLKEMPQEGLLEEKVAIAGLQFTGKSIPDKKSIIDTYRFPFQECEIQQGDELKDENGESFGKVFSIDGLMGAIEIRKGLKIKDWHTRSVFAFSEIKDDAKKDSIFRLATYVANHSIAGPGDFQCARDLLLNLFPRTKSPFESSLPPQERAVAWVNQLDNGVLPIQGPPGTGKSHTAAQMIVDLVRKGKKIGITALSHKVITGLMEKVIETARKSMLSVRCMRKVTEKSDRPSPGIVEEMKYGPCEAAIRNGGVNVLGGSAWLWAREEFKNSVDVLFVDEAGQLALIDTLAVSQAAANVVLLGDPQQLKQPQQGSHPDGTEVSALEHVLGEHQTIPPDRGILLDETWRMHPSICQFVSELFYENRLHSRPGLEKQQLSGETDFDGAGLWFVPVEHDGNQNSSTEEVQAVASIVTKLTGGKAIYTDRFGDSWPVTAADIKVISPFNAQVNLLKQTLPKEVQVGTVDKFQGQEAPIILFSMATSRPEDAPRGMEFLYSSNRLNVAVSRARACFILVASPALLEPDCRNVRQMKLANAFCRFMEIKQPNH